MLQNQGSAVQIWKSEIDWAIRGSDLTTKSCYWIHNWTETVEGGAALKEVEPCRQAFGDYAFALSQYLSLVPMRSAACCVFLPP